MSWNLDLSYSPKTPSSPAYFAALKDTYLGPTLQLESATTMFCLEEPILKNITVCSRAKKRENPRNRGNVMRGV